MTIEGLIKEAYFPNEETVKSDSDFEKIAKALNTASSIPYQPHTYEAACGIMKIASQAFEGLLKKNQDLEKLSAVRDILDDMIDRGMISKEDVHTKTAALMKKNDRELEVFKEAVKLASVKTGNIFESETSTISTNQKSMFEDVI